MYTNYYHNLSISYDIMLINLSLASSLSCLNCVAAKPLTDKMLTEMYKFCPSSLKKEQDAISSVDYSLSRKRPDRGGASGSLTSFSPLT